MNKKSIILTNYEFFIIKEVLYLQGSSLYYFLVTIFLGEGRSMEKYGKTDLPNNEELARLFVKEQNRGGTEAGRAMTKKVGRAIAAAEEPCAQHFLKHGCLERWRASGVGHVGRYVLLGLLRGQFPEVKIVRRERRRPKNGKSISNDFPFPTHTGTRVGGARSGPAI